MFFSIFLFCAKRAWTKEKNCFSVPLSGKYSLGFLGLNPSTPKGYQNIRMDLKVKTAEENLDRLRGFTQFSPVYSTLTNGTPVEINIESK